MRNVNEHIADKLQTQLYITMGSHLNSRPVSQLYTDLRSMIWSRFSYTLHLELINQIDTHERS